MSACGTRPILCLTNSYCEIRSQPPKVTPPSESSVCPVRADSRVDLPAPEGPRIAVSDAGLKLTLIESRRTLSPTVTDKLLTSRFSWSSLLGLSSVLPVNTSFAEPIVILSPGLSVYLWVRIPFT